jgi:hypothetical protein
MSKMRIHKDKSEGGKDLETEIDMEEIELALRAMKYSLDKNNYYLPLIFNTALFLLITGDTLEAILLLKKLNSFLPMDIFIYHNLQFAQLI